MRMNKTIKEYCEEYYAYAVKIRRELHRHPEIGMACIQTTDLICNELHAHGIPFRRTGEAGVIAEIKGTKEESKAVVMLRADMDALPVEELTGLPYASEIPGMMHACGHDLHTGMLLGTTRILMELREEFAGTIRLVFQPGEEISKGASHMIAHGALENVSYGFGIHMDPLSPLNVVRCKKGPDWAAVDHFVIHIHGKGAHGATPHKGSDAIVAASAVVMGLQTMVSRLVDPMKSLVVTVGKMTAGSSYNIIAEEAVLEGTCRCFDLDVRDQIPSMLQHLAGSIAQGYQCTAEVTVNHHSLPLINDAQAVDLLHTSAMKVMNEEHWQEAQPEMIGEDFSEYAALVPCVFAHLGADAGYPLHSGHIQFKEEAMKLGMALEVQFSLDVLA